MLAVCFDEDEALERWVRGGCGDVFVEGVLGADGVGGRVPGESGEFGGGVEVDVGVDYGDVGCGCEGHCAVLNLGSIIFGQSEQMVVLWTLWTFRRHGRGSALRF